MSAHARLAFIGTLVTRENAMKMSRRLLLAGGAGALGTALLAGRALAGKAGASGTAGAASKMFDTLRASGPRIVAGEDPQARAFDRFAGAWDIDYCNIRDDGSRENTRGQLLAGWVLDGRALQDIWIGFPSAGGDRFMGTTLRFYDDERKAWRITWISPMQQAVTLLEGGTENGRIVLLGSGPRGRLRWTFNDITDHDFRWRGELSTDDGNSWRLREDHYMRRRSPATA
jgi:hypothetical protein